MNSADVSCSAPGVLEQIQSPQRDVQIWIAHLDSILPNALVELGNSLNSAERARAAQFRFARDRQRYVATRGLLRRVLGAALDRPASAIVFEYGSHGKPEVAQDYKGQTLRFNISHAAGLAIFALAWNCRLGVDVEATQRLVNKPEDLSDLAMRVLSPREFAIWDALQSNDMRCGMLLRAWTRKEAYLKATGEGLSEDLQSIEVDLQSPLTIRGWTLHDLRVPTGFAAALAVERA